MKSARAPKRPNPQTKTGLRSGRKVRYLWVSKTWLKDGTVPRRGGRTYDVRRNEWKHLKRLRPVTQAALDRIAEIERAWAA